MPCLLSSRRLAEACGICLHAAAAVAERQALPADASHAVADGCPWPWPCLLPAMHLHLPPGSAPAASSIIFDQAENRMHAQNGIMLHAMGVA
jgi:hypothetical protein